MLSKQSFRITRNTVRIIFCLKRITRKDVSSITFSFIILGFSVILVTAASGDANALLRNHHYSLFEKTVYLGLETCLAIPTFKFFLL